MLDLSENVTGRETAPAQPEEPTAPIMPETLDAEVEPVPQANVGNTVRASWNFSLDDIRANIATYPSEAKEALINLYLWCIDPRHPVAKPQAAERIGISDNTLYKLLTGKYLEPGTKRQMAPTPKTIDAINEFLRKQREIMQSGLVDFVLTPTAKRIVTAANLARESRTPVFLVGPSHIGKTWTLERHIAPNNNHGRTPYIRMGAASGLGGMVRRIADGVGVSDKSNTADLVGRIKRALTPETLPLLDELHLLAHTYRKGSFHSCMEVIREIYDEAGCGMLLCFTMLDAVTASSQKELQQLWRRGVHKVILPNMPTKGDVAAILDHHGLPFPDKKQKVDVKIDGKQIVEQPYEILRQVGKQEALKAITERIRYAKKLAQKEGAALDWTHFVRAHVLIKSQSLVTEEWD